MLSRLKEYKLLTSSNTKIIVANPDRALGIYVLLGILHEAGLVTAENVDIFILIYIKKPTQIRGIVEALCRLKDFELVTEENKRGIINNLKHGWSFFLLFGVLRKAALLTAKNVNVFILAYIKQPVPALSIVDKFDSLSSDDKSTAEDVAEAIKKMLPPGSLDSNNDKASSTAMHSTQLFQGVPQNQQSQTNQQQESSSQQNACSNIP